MAIPWSKPEDIPYKVVNQLTDGSFTMELGDKQAGHGTDFEFMSVGVNVSASQGTAPMYVVFLESAPTANTLGFAQGMAIAHDVLDYQGLRFARDCAWIQMKIDHWNDPNNPTDQQLTKEQKVEQLIDRVNPILAQPHHSCTHGGHGVAAKSNHPDNINIIGDCDNATILQAASLGFAPGAVFKGNGVEYSVPHGIK